MTYQQAFEYIEANFDGEKLKCGDDYLYPYPPPIVVVNERHVAHGFYMDDNGIIGSFEPIKFELSTEVTPSQQSKMAILASKAMGNKFRA